MVKIMSEQGYPTTDKILVRIDYFIKADPCEGGILLVGKDSQGREFKPKTEPIVRSFYVLPSGAQYGIPVGSEPEKNHPALYFPFTSHCKLTSQEIVAKADANEDFTDALEMNVMDDSYKPISLDEKLDKLFLRFVLGYAVLELADITVQGRIRTHFWGELYFPKSPEFEKLLEAYRG